MTPAEPITSVDKARALFPHTAQGKLYFNHAGTSPLSQRVVRAMEAHLHDRSEGRLDTYSRDVRMVAECKSLLSRLVHAESPDRIALTANTSDSLNIVAGGMPFRQGDRVIIGEFEFPANVWPWLNLRNRGVEIDLFRSGDGRVSPAEIEALIRPGTRLVAISAVQYLSGFRADLETIGRLCSNRGVWFVVDGIQAVGAIGIDVQRMGIHALAAGAQKWQTAPHGNGFLYLTEEFQNALTPPTLGWLAVEDPWDFADHTQKPASSARRFEGGSLNMPGLWGYHAALSTLTEFTTEAIEDRLKTLTQILIDEFRRWNDIELITPVEPDHRAGIVTVRPKAVDASLVFKHLLKRQVTVAVRQGALRISPHFYNTESEMRSMLAHFREVLNPGD